MWFDKWLLLRVIGRGVLLIGAVFLVTFGPVVGAVLLGMRFGGSFIAGFAAGAVSLFWVGWVSFGLPRLLGMKPAI